MNHFSVLVRHRYPVLDPTDPTDPTDVFLYQLLVYIYGTYVTLHHHLFDIFQLVVPCDKSAHITAATTGIGEAGG